MAQVSAPRFQHGVHAAAEKAHLFYFGAVFIEGHGWYAASAGVCLAIGLLMEVSGAAAFVGGLLGLSVAASAGSGEA